MLVLVQRTIDAVSCPIVSHLIQYALVTTIPLLVFSFPEANGDSKLFFTSSTRDERCNTAVAELY